MNNQTPKKYYSSTKNYSIFKDGYFNMKGIPSGFNYAYGGTIAPSSEPIRKIDFNVKICDSRNDWYAE